MELPAILSGPIVRRVEKQQIYIWIATSKEFNIDADLFEISKGAKIESYKYKLVNERTNTTTVKLGKKLFVHIIKIEPEGVAFPVQTLLGYNLFFSTDSETMDLGTLGLLSPNNPDSIVYGNLSYPSFYIHSQNNGPILYGSCRKLHGNGHDALAAGDEKIKAAYFHPELRPNALFMVGDQLYADDVADPMAPVLFSLARELTGNEPTNLDVLDNRLGVEPHRTNIKKIHGRQAIMEDLCQFTTRKADNHLITLGEYAAMYLLSWSPQAWPLAGFDSFNKHLQEESHNNIPISNIKHSIPITKALGKKKMDYNDQMLELQQFRDTLPQVRRLLANIPTYMIFDDHDLTDDWNISSDWKSKVWNASLGRHVITNGLTAYWAFQGWGNDPAAFNDDFLKTINKQTATNRLEGTAYEEWVQLLWGFNSWTFIAPTEPVTLFLDTRTQRGFEVEPKQTLNFFKLTQTVQGPELISMEAWDHHFHRLFASGWKSGSPLIVVSAVPFYGIDLFETFILRYISPLTLIGLPVQTMFDIEAWKYNGKAFTKFLDTIAKWNPSTCVILSGDAHASSTAVSRLNSNDGNGTTLIQFTSSPLNNSTFSGFLGHLLKGAVRFYEWVTNSPTIYRSCDSNFCLLHSTNPNHADATTSIWSEDIRYLPMESGALIKTNNNLGLLSFNDKNIHNKFLDAPNHKGYPKA